MLLVACVQILQIVIMEIVRVAIVLVSFFKLRNNKVFRLITKL